LIELLVHSGVVPVQIEILDDWTSIASLSAQWNDLLARSSANSLFHTWEWLQCWRDTAAQNASPLAIIARNPDGSLAGIAPFYLGKMRLASCLDLRVLRPMGDGFTGAEYPALIAKTGTETTVYPALLRGIQGVSSRWDILWMPYLADWQACTSELLTALKHSRLRYFSRPRTFGSVPLPDSAAAFAKALPRRMRDQIRKLERQKELGFDQCTTASDIDAYLDSLLELHARRWEKRNDAGAFARQPRVAAFFRRMAPIALQQGWLGLFRLREGDMTRAVQFGYFYNGVFFQMQEGFDPDADPGIGNLLRLRVVANCIERGIREYDFLGGFTEHKRRWQAVERIGSDLMAVSPRLKTLPLLSGRIWPKGRFLEDTTWSDGSDQG
jgi:CelD/BcsL family acetyltransferase involved in cellulose biosynthesis